MLDRNSPSTASLWSFLQGKVEHASIRIENSNWKNKGLKDKEIKVMYNPEELSLSQHVTVDGVGNNIWSHRSRRSGGDVVFRFVRGSYGRSKADQ